MTSPPEHRTYTPSLGFRVRKGLRDAPALSWRSAAVTAISVGFTVAMALTLANRLFIVAGSVLLVWTLLFRQTLALRSRDYFEGVWMGYSDTLDDLSERFYLADVEDSREGTPEFFNKFFLARAVRDAGFFPKPEVVTHFESLVLDTSKEFSSVWPDRAQGLSRAVSA